MKVKVIIVLHVIFLALIITAYLPSLNISNERYNTKKSAVTPVKLTEVESAKTLAKEAVAEVAEVEEAVSSVVEEQVVPVAAVIEGEVEEAITPVKVAVNDVVSNVESKVEAATEKVASAVSAPATAGLYSVVDGNKLDAHSYAGFKLYRNWCARCHGTYGQGMVGPNLADSLKLISKEEFYDTVENGKTGTIGSMPSWKANVQVMENRDQLYAYLMARSDGAIGVEKPKKQ